MKFLVSWTEHHSAVVEADQKFDTDAGVYRRFDFNTTFNSYGPQEVLEDEDCLELTVESKAGMARHYSHLLYDACMEFVRKCECGEARSKRSYKQMKQALDLIHNREERT